MGQRIAMKYRDQVRPFAAPVGVLLDWLHGAVFELSLDELRDLEAAVEVTLGETADHRSGNFHHAASFLAPYVRSAIDHKVGLLLDGGRRA